MVNVVDMPIKCPVAPLEFCFLADWYLQELGIRDRVELTYVTPLDGAFTKPVASATLGGLLEEKGVGLVTEFNTGEVDGPGGRLVSYDGREVGFDLAVVVPLHSGAAYVGRSPGLGDELNFVPTDEHTLQSKGPTQCVRHRRRRQPAGVEGGFGHPLRRRESWWRTSVDSWPARRSTPATTATPIASSSPASTRRCLIDFNYDTEPLPGHFPTAVGLPLLKESRLNHLGKLMFQSFYWHSLLPGRDIPGVGSSHAYPGQASRNRRDHDHVL